MITRLLYAEGFDHPVPQIRYAGTVARLLSRGACPACAAKLADRRTLRAARAALQLSLGEWGKHDDLLMLPHVVTNPDDQTIRVLPPQTPEERMLERVARLAALWEDPRWPETMLGAAFETGVADSLVAEAVVDVDDVKIGQAATTPLGRVHASSESELRAQAAAVARRIPWEVVVVALTRPPPRLWFPATGAERLARLP